MNKKALSEADIRTKFITPAICGSEGAGWDLMTQVREEAYFTKGRVIVRGKTVQRGEGKKADYLLYYKPNLPIAVIEAKDNNHAVGAGMQQALEYAEILDVPFAYSSNGDAFLEYDRTATGGTVTREIPLDRFPSPEELWSRYCKAKALTPKQVEVATQDYRGIERKRRVTESMGALYVPLPYVACHERFSWLEGILFFVGCNLRSNSKHQDR